MFTTKRMSLNEFGRLVNTLPVAQGNENWVRYQAPKNEIKKVMPKEFTPFKGTTVTPYGAERKIYRHTPSLAFIIFEGELAYVEVHSNDSSYDRSLLIYSTVRNQ
jgi:hypothetical protein